MVQHILSSLKIQDDFYKSTYMSKYNWYPHELQQKEGEGETYVL